jgi:hypothetical protein
VLPVDKYDQPDNDFLFFDRDRHGHGCPLGSHVRRGNPRDGLAPTPNDKQTLLDAANNHRILRRGRKYGPTSQHPRKDDGKDRGLLFICLNTDITRQFEFVQQTWMLNPNFAFLYDEVDPLLGPKGMLTIPSSRCAGSSRSTPSSRWRAANISSCRACRRFAIWRRYERAHSRDVLRPGPKGFKGMDAAHGASR